MRPISMLPAICALLLGILACASTHEDAGNAARSEEQLEFTVPPGWTLANYAEDTARGYVIGEWVPEGQTISSWRRLFTMQNFPRTWGGDTPQATLEQLQAARETTMPGVTSWTVLRSEGTRVVYEWSSDAIDQREIAAILFGRWNRWRVAYSVKGRMESSERARWIDLIDTVRVREPVPRRR